MSSRLQPPQPVNGEGQPRRVGVEIELSGLSLGQMTRIIQDIVGGEIKNDSAYEARVVDTELGSVRVEFDATLFREMKIRNFFADLKLEVFDEEDRENLEKSLASVASWLVPYEVVFPPIPIEQMELLEAVRERLGRDAQGTGTSVVNAFGLHLNVELPALDVETILSYLRAFLILYEELIRSHDIDPTRKLSGFITPFDKNYTMLVLNEAYKPTLDEFIDDYLAANATRNRPLDLLPLLCYLDQEKIRRRLPEEKISARPAFHYRLPNSSVDEEDWSISREWMVWMKVEKLASDERQLTRRCRYKLRQLQGPFFYWLRRLWRTKPLLSKKPMIAITGPDKGGFPAWACTWLAVKRAGGLPVRLTPSMFRDDPTLPPFDGLILGGGADVDPGRYDSELQVLLEDKPPKDRVPWIRRFLSWLVAPILFLWRATTSLSASGVDLERDDFEQSCLDRALREDIPVLGICRGAQFINIHFGGNLIDDLSNFYGEVHHASTLLPRTPVTVEKRSYLEAVLGVSSLGVNSLHNQAVDELGDGVRVTARTDSGIVQAVELEDRPYVMGVQWHPEYLPVSRLQQKLFQALVQEALARKR